MEVIGFLFAAVLVIALFGAVLFVLWLFFVPIKPDATRGHYRPTADDDPNWEDHIRHDPYHPGGNQ